MSKSSGTNGYGGQTGLLVSVRDALEAEVALRGGANWIDVKEPLRGPLGRAEPMAIDQVVQTVAQRTPISVALGEVLDYSEALSDCGSRDAPTAAAHQSVALPKAVELAKFGLAECRARSGWRQIWARACQSLPAHVGVVAVCYADWRTAGAPCPEDVADLASENWCRALLVDTYDKSNGSLFDYWSPASLSHFLNRFKQRGKMVVVGGSISSTTLAAAVALQPDFIAVRGAVCGDGREGRVSLELVGNMANRIAELSAKKTATACENL